MVKTPLRCASVGTTLRRVMPVRSRVPCQSAKKNVLFLRMGPPSVKPYWLRRNSGFAPGWREVVARVQIFVAEELEQRAVKLVAAGFPDHHHGAAVRAAVLRRVGIDVQPELLHARR